MEIAGSPSPVNIVNGKLVRMCAEQWQIKSWNVFFFTSPEFFVGNKTTLLGTVIAA
jgi:hypothetical protein